MTRSPATALLAAGTYRGGGGRGLHPLSQAAEDGGWRVGAPYGDAANASFSVRGARHGLHYIVDEGAEGRVGIHRLAETGWHRLGSVPTGGGAPCHVALNPHETLLAVAHYASGSIAVIPLDPATGLPSGAAQVHPNQGSGPNPDRQEAPHAHWVGFSRDGAWLYQTDLGTDEVLAFAVDEAGRLTQPRIAFVAPPGAGPRHLAFHPTLDHRAYLVNELSSTLTTLDRAADGSLVDRGTLPTLPDGWRGDSIVAHVAVNAAGTRMYVSNRGHDSIAVFTLDPAGVPTLLEHVASGGAYPRFFLLLEDHGLMAVAHEKSQTVTTLKVDPAGRLTPTGVVLAIPGVAYLLAVDLA